MKNGTLFNFGKYQIKNETPWPIEWKIVHQTDKYQIAHVSKIIDVMAFDATEPTNPDENKNDIGNNFWHLSNIMQFLNSDKEDWYHPMHEFDAPPITENLLDNSIHGLINPYENREGFLYHFTEEEKALLKDFSFVLANPNRYDDNKIINWTGKVWLPTITQLTGHPNGFSLNEVFEGDQFDEYKTHSKINNKVNKKLSFECAKAYDLQEDINYDFYYWSSSAQCGSPLAYCVCNGVCGAFPNLDINGLAPCICLPIDFSA